MTEDEKLATELAETLRRVGNLGGDWLNIARAAISAVREHDKEKGLVHAGSTGAERSSDLSARRVGFLESSLAEAASRFEDVAEVLEKNPSHDAVGFLRASGRRFKSVATDGCVNSELTFLWRQATGPTDDRSAPAASREPNLVPSSLTVPHRHMKGGIQG